MTFLKPRNRPVLCDADGVIFDFMGTIVDYIKNQHGIELSLESITMDVREHPLVKDIWTESCEKFVTQPNFAQTLKTIPGSVDAVKKLMEKYNVVFLTSAYGTSPTWTFDRFHALKKLFDISRDDVIFARDKRFVDGITLIDDRWENIIDWSNYNQKPGILFKQPWNSVELKKAETVMSPPQCYGRKIVRMDGKLVDFYASDSWPEIFEIIERINDIQKEK